MSRYLNRVNGFRQGAKITASCQGEHDDGHPWVQVKTVAGYDQGELVRAAKLHAAEHPGHDVVVLWTFEITYRRPVPRRRKS